MRDSRVKIIDETTISTDGTTNGANIDLLENYVGDHLYGTGPYGLPVEILASNVVTGTGDGFTVTAKWQVAPDNSGSPGSWVDASTIGVFTIDTDGNFMKNGVIYGLTRAKLQSRLKTSKPWARVVFTAAGISGGETIKIRAWLSDGTLPLADTGVIS